MADITKLVKKKPEDAKTADLDAMALREHDWKLINEFGHGEQRRTMPQGIRKRYVQN